MGENCTEILNKNKMHQWGNFTAGQVLKALMEEAWSPLA